MFLELTESPGWQQAESGLAWLGSAVFACSWDVPRCQLQHLVLMLVAAPRPCLLWWLKGVCNHYSVTSLHWLNSRVWLTGVPGIEQLVDDGNGMH